MDFGFIIGSGISNGLIWAIMSIGIYITYRILDIADLGIEGTFPLGASVVAILIVSGFNPVIATLIALFAGAFFGTITGILHTKFKIPAILSGIITMTGLFTINMLVLGGFKEALPSLALLNPTTNVAYPTIFTFVRTFLQNNQNNVLSMIIGLIIIILLVVVIPMIIRMIKKIIKHEFKNKLTSSIIQVIICSIISLIIIIGLVFIVLGLLNIGFVKSLNTLIIKLLTVKTISVIIVAGIILSAVFGICYWFFGTEIGMSLRATGNNSRMAKAQGINTDLMIILGLAISNALVALCGAIYAQSTLAANTQQGQGTIVIGLATIVIGESIFGRQDFKKSIISVIVGSILYFLLEAVAIDFQVQHYLKLVRAILVTVVLVIPFIKNKIKLKKKETGGLNNVTN